MLSNSVDTVVPVLDTGTQVTMDSFLAIYGYTCLLGARVRKTVPTWPYLAVSSRSENIYSLGFWSLK